MPIRDVILSEPPVIDWSSADRTGFGPKQTRDGAPCPRLITKGMFDSSIEDSSATTSPVMLVRARAQTSKPSYENCVLRCRLATPRILEQPRSTQPASEHFGKLIYRGAVVGGLVHEFADIAPHRALPISERNGANQFARLLQSGDRATVF